MDKPPTLYTVMETLGSLQTNINDLRRELLGNGQPGRIQRLEADTARIDEQVQHHGRRMAYWGGAVTVVSVTAGYVLRWAGSILFK